MSPHESHDTPPRGWRAGAGLWFFRLAPGLHLPAGWFQPGVTALKTQLPARPGPLALEIVSHCWRYAHLLAYQLSSLVLAPPQRLTVRMTVYHADGDADTRAWLDHFGSLQVPNVTWNWVQLPREQLLRRAIGRNRAALASTADWVWFTDCDLVFHTGCLDALAAALAGRHDALVYPREERCTPMLPQDDVLLRAGGEGPRVVTIDPSRFESRRPGKATGPLQIVHGDVARRLGYCAALSCFQSPSEHWRKTYEDRVFRWLLGTEGTPLDIPGVYRIKHIEKGRYHGPALINRLRSAIRRAQQHPTPSR